MTSLATIKPKIHILNIVIEPNIAYVYYAVSCSKPNIRKLDKILNKLTKETCNILKSNTNIGIFLSTKDFNINITSLLPDYIHCTCKQLLYALSNLGQLGKSTKDWLNMYPSNMMDPYTSPNYVTKHAQDFPMPALCSYWKNNYKTYKHYPQKIPN